MPSVICSFFSACLLVGRHEVKENCGGPLVQQFEHWRFCWPCSPLSGVGLVKAIATLQRWLFTASCLSPNANMNWGISASHPPKASSCCSHHMQFDTVPTKTDAAAKQNDGILGPIWPWFLSLFLLASSPWSSLSLVLPGVLPSPGSQSFWAFFFPGPPWAAGASNPPWLSSFLLHAHLSISIVFFIVRWRELEDANTQILVFTSIAEQ